MIIVNFKNISTGVPQVGLFSLLTCAFLIIAIVIFDLPVSATLSLLVFQSLIVGFFVYESTLRAQRKRQEKCREELLGLLADCESLRLTFGRLAQDQSKPSLNKIQQSTHDKLVQEVEFGEDLRSESADVDQYAPQVGILEALKELVAQTRLLAINAEAQARQVGDRGRGFAEVAARVELLGELAAEVATTLQVTQPETAEHSFSDVLSQMTDLDEASFDLMSESLNQEENEAQIEAQIEARIDDADSERYQTPIDDKARFGGLDHIANNNSRKVVNSLANAENENALHKQISSIQRRTERLILLMIDS